MNPRIQKLHASIELIASLCIIGGLVAMQLNQPSLYTQYGICFWAAAQAVLIGWWDKRVSSATACVLMGGLNMLGAGAFLAGCYINDSELGMFISCCYLASSTMQMLGGAVRLPRNDSARITRLLQRLLARKILILVTAMQALAAMCFILLIPVAGMFYTVAAFMGLGINILVLQLEMQQMAEIREAVGRAERKPA